MAILILENGYSDLIGSRYPLGQYLQSEGYEVHYACPKPEKDTIHEVPMSRNRISPFELIKSCSKVVQIEAKFSVEILISFRFIPNVLNYLASYKNRRVKRVAVITGLGYAFISTNKTVSARIQRYMIRLFYGIASKRVQIVAQNPDDLADLGVINGKVILGSGVINNDTAIEHEFSISSIRLLYVGRLLKSKGIQTTINVFEQLKTKNPQVSLTIAGTTDEHNPDSINEEELIQIRNKEGVNYLGFVENMKDVYVKCNVFLFPSNYREGVPRVIIEALKYGLTIVTKEMPGCKEMVRGNGFLMTENCNVEDVVDYLSNLNSFDLLTNKKLSVELFKKTFSSDVIYPKYLELFK